MPDLGFVFAAGEGKYAGQGLYLTRSIAKTNPHSEIYAFVPESESPDHLDKIESHATIIEGTQRVPEYGISTKIDALAAAEEVSDTDYLLLLDTDTLVVDEITVHERASDLFLKPVDVGLQYWGRESESASEWRAIANRLGLPTPEWRYRSTFDDKPIPPYWNAGFVLTANSGFGERWLDAVEAVYPDLSYEWHADQVTLGLLSQEYDTTALDERYNYPLHLRLRTSDNLKAIHYHNYGNLQKARPYQEFLREIDMWHEVSAADYSYLRGAWRYAKRKTLPMNEEHRLERMWNRVRHR